MRLGADERFRGRGVTIAFLDAGFYAHPDLTQPQDRILAYVDVTNPRATRAALDVPVVGTVPAIKPAAEATRTKVIGVLGTPATVRQAYVDNLAAEFASDCVVLRHGAPDLAAMAEAKLRGEAVPAEAYTQAMAGLTGQPRGEEMDIVVLACTHFPLVEDELAAAARRPLRFVHGGQGIARRVAHLLRDADWTGCEPTGLAVFTARDEKAAALTPALARRGLEVDYL